MFEEENALPPAVVVAFRRMLEVRRVLRREALEKFLEITPLRRTAAAT
jgi:hypothetical protein